MWRAHTVATLGNPQRFFILDLRMETSTQTHDPLCHEQDSATFTYGDFGQWFHITFVFPPQIQHAWPLHSAVGERKERHNHKADD